MIFGGYGLIIQIWPLNGVVAASGGSLRRLQPFVRGSIRRLSVLSACSNWRVMAWPEASRRKCGNGMSAA